MFAYYVEFRAYSADPDDSSFTLRNDYFVGETRDECYKMLDDIIPCAEIEYSAMIEVESCPQAYSIFTEEQRDGKEYRNLGKKCVIDMKTHKPIAIYSYR